MGPHHGFGIAEVDVVHPVTNRDRPSAAPVPACQGDGSPGSDWASERTTVIRASKCRPDARVK